MTMSPHTDGAASTADAGPPAAKRVSPQGRAPQDVAAGDRTERRADDAGAVFSDWAMI